MIPKRKNILINLLNGIEVKNMVYLTKWAGKYKILSRVRVIKLLSREAKRSKIPSRAAVGRKGRYFYDLGLKGK